MQKFQFLLLTYWLPSPGFLKEVAPDVVRTVRLCVNLQNMFFFNALKARHEHFLCHTPGLTYTTRQLCLRWDRPMFATADFKPGDVQYNVRWST